MITHYISAADIEFEDCLAPVRVVFSNFANLKNILVFFVGYHELSNFEFVLSASAFIFDRQLKPRY